MKYLFDYFWKPASPYWEFGSSVFWDSISYTVISVFWKMLMEIVNALAPWRPCACLKCVSGLRRLEKNWTFWDAFMSLIWCSITVQIKMKENGYSFSYLLLCIDRNSCISYCNEFFWSVFQIEDWSFLVLQCHGNVWSWNPQRIWPRLGFLWSFLLEDAFFRRLHVSMDWKLHNLFNCDSFLTKSIFFDSLRHILVCSSNMFVLFRHRIL